MDAQDTSKVIMELFKEEGPEVRSKIRDFLGSRNRTELFENLDDFSHCLKMLDGQARLISTQMNRMLVKSGTEKNINVAELDVKYAKQMRDISLIKKSDVQELIQKKITIPQEKLSPRFQQEKIFVPLIKVQPENNQLSENLNNSEKEDTEAIEQYTKRNSKLQNHFSGIKGRLSLLEQKNMKKANSLSEQFKDIKHITNQLNNYQSEFNETLANLQQVKPLKGKSNNSEKMEKQIQEYQKQQTILQNAGKEDEVDNLLNRWEIQYKLKENVDLEKKQNKNTKSFKLYDHDIQRNIYPFDYDRKQGLIPIKELQQRNDDDNNQMKKQSSQIEINQYYSIDPKKAKNLIDDMKNHDQSERVQRIKQKFIKHVQHIRHKMKVLNLEFDDVIKNQAFRQYPLERPGASEFLYAVKENNTDKVYLMLQKCKYHVYDFDSTNQTPLHWAVKRNLFKMVILLLDNGADLEAQDIGGRTVLFLAIKNDSKPMINILLARKANPFIKTISKKKPKQYVVDNNIVITQLLDKAEKLHYEMQMLPIKKQQEFWIKYAVPVFSNNNYLDHHIQENHF